MSLGATRHQRQELCRTGEPRTESVERRKEAEDACGKYRFSTEYIFYLRMDSI